MRIGIDIKALKNGSTGISRYLRSIMDELQDIDRVNEYVLFEPQPLAYTLKNPNWRKVLVQGGLPGTLWLQIVLPSLLRKKQIESFWAPEQVCPLWGVGTTRIVTTIHDLAFRHVPDSYVWSNLLIQRFSAPLVLRNSNAVITVSNRIRNEVLEAYDNWCKPGKVYAIPNGGPDWSIPKWYRRKERANFLFFAGNLEPRKNLIKLIHALEILKTEGWDIPLHLAGPEGWKNSHLFKAISESPVRKNIHLRGYLSEENLQTEYLRCHALVYPSVYEGFGLPVLEAITLDCPVLTSRDSVMHEIAGDCAIYFDPHDPQDIADSIRRSYQGVAPSAVSLHSIAQSYSWRICAKKHLAVLVGDTQSATN